ncbi:2Fe-2S iron-sulfur cluster binding domain-containing protein [Aurantimonas aggregata]|uniref:2Fe-2S iron-sulfur cluster binding domain-containing protein n=1 Tax=Aurantimonas aggregata TaxID=2047720 RepID=A0A6L9MN17_9HYPH|nr:2Fe-2S iron-sulfur cluster-binding protein [Aurantimonas aggregata]NDV89115.1 2Fe-2S iron-sulfur cluster binding domain-containing protein [Aurantimonas aggregata]
MPDVTLLNIGRTIRVPDGETILSAALAEGIDYPHGCKSGRCGICKSRRASGDVDLLDHSRFALTPAERDAGLILACRAVPKGSASVAWLEDEDTARHPVRSIEAEVVGTELLTHDILRLRLKGGSPPLQFAPGQYATLELPGETSRDYSMANAPGAEVVEFHVRRVPGGRTSGAIHDRLQTGDRVWLTGPRGAANLRAGHTGPILAVAGGSGLAPILSILESAVAQGMRQPIRVYIGGRDERDLYGLDRLARLAAQHGDMTVTPVLSAPSAPTDRRTGFLHTVVHADLQAFDGWKCYTAGPPAMIDALTEVVLARGLQREDLHADVFFTPTTAPRSVEIAAAD